MLFGGFGYTLYSAQMLYLSDWWGCSLSISNLVSLQMWTNVILRSWRHSPTRLLYGSAILNGMGAALLWTSQVQTNITDVQKYFHSHRESFRCKIWYHICPKIPWLSLTGKVSCHQLRAAHCRPQRWYFLDSLPDEWSPGVDLCFSAFSQCGRDWPG